MELLYNYHYIMGDLEANVHTEQTYTNQVWLGLLSSQ